MPTQFPLISINGVIGASLSPLDRGFAYGDGLFETCRIRAGRVPLCDWHMARLLMGCERLQIPVEGMLLQNYASRLLAEAGLADGVIKISVTRGAGGRGYRLPDDVSPTYCLAITPFIERSENQHGVTVRICQQRLAENAALAGIKHMNRLEQVLARAEWSDEHVAEGLLLNGAGHVIEATSSNIFVVRDRQLITPDLSYAGVAGVMRRVIIEQLAPRLPCTVQVEPLRLEDVCQADEVFLCNSLNGIWPVLQVLAPAPVNFRRGPVTAALQQVLATFLNQIESDPQVAI